MSRLPSGLSPRVETLLAREREGAPLSAAVRARAIARARAALVAGGSSDVRSNARSHAPGLRWAVAAALVCFAGAAAGAVGYELRARLTPASDPPPARTAPPLPIERAVTLPATPATPATETVSPGPDLRPRPRASRGAVARAELALLGRAREAVASGEYAAALPPIAEHVRHFKDGRLAEEREALRVKALAGLGRSDEARRAAVAFRIRFPRSVLLPAVRQMPDATP
jgi:hypothetical protein